MKRSSVRIGSRETAARLIGIAALWLVCVAAGAQQTGPNATGSVIAATNILAAPGNIIKAPALDSKRLFALGMIETGNDDTEVGAAGEVSRYQIHPTVWKAYSQRKDYQNTQAAIQVAQQHWTWLTEYFVEKTGRQPNDFDMYVLWNTKFGYYARRGFTPGRLAASVRDRANRFVNLVNRKL